MTLIHECVLSKEDTRSQFCRTSPLLMAACRCLSLALFQHLELLQFRINIVVNKVMILQ